MTVYNRYSTYLINKYGGKVYKIPIHIDVTCPNRDGNCGTGGCTFCNEVGAGYEMLEAKEPIASQIERNIAYIGKRYKAKYFIAYLQNYSNTYMTIGKLEEILAQIEHEKIVALSLSTRPDCINDAYLELINNWAKRQDVDVCIELGLQTINYHTLHKINRGHGLAEYIDAVLRIKRYGFEVCTHLIPNLPWDTKEDIIECAKVMSALKIDYIKLHALYILKDTVMGEQYLNQEFTMISEGEYKERVIEFLRYLDEEVVIQRIIGRVPEEYALFANWGSSWWKIHDEIVATMEVKGYQQGDRCDYLNGRALNKFNQ